MYVYGVGGGATTLALDRVNVCGELVKAGNAIPCYMEPLDWSIIILGTHPFLFLPVCLSPATPPLPRPPSLRGSLYLRVIVAVMTYLALSSAPCNTNTLLNKRTLRYGHTQPCQANTCKHTSSPCCLAPCCAGLTGSKALMPDVHYTPFSSPCFLPPSINPTSLTLHLHYDGHLSPALFIMSSSFTSPPLLSLLAPHFSTFYSLLCFLFCYHTQFRL